MRVLAGHQKARTIRRATIIKGRMIGLEKHCGKHPRNQAGIGNGPAASQKYPGTCLISASMRRFRSGKIAIRRSSKAWPAAPAARVENCPAPVRLAVERAKDRMSGGRQEAEQRARISFSSSAFKAGNAPGRAPLRRNDTGRPAEADTKFETQPPAT